MSKKITVLILFFFLLTLTTYQSNHKHEKVVLFKIKSIEVENSNYVNQIKLKNYLYFLYEGKDLVNFNKNELNLVTKKFDLIESIKVKKIYPNKLIFTIFEKKPIAVLFAKKDKFFVTSNNEKVKYFEDERLSKLPSIIGKKENFVSLYGTLLDLNFPINKIESYNHFEVGRWDINLQDNRTIKLPPIDYKESLIEFINLNKNVNFEKFKTFDFRIKNQLIVK
tara:strand:+ start:2236 stop:2904 length:669 start_codon:yes stop_codon:yes gene_type:complete